MSSATSILASLVLKSRFYSRQVYYLFVDPFLIHPPPGCPKAASWEDLLADLCVKIHNILTTPINTTYQCICWALNRYVMPWLNEELDDIFGFTIKLPDSLPGYFSPRTTTRKQFLPLARQIILWGIRFLILYAITPPHTRQKAHEAAVLIGERAHWWANQGYDYVKKEVQTKLDKIALDGQIRDYYLHVAEKIHGLMRRSDKEFNYTQDGRVVQDYWMMSQQERRRRHMADHIIEHGTFPFEHPWWQEAGRQRLKVKAAAQLREIDREYRGTRHRPRHFKRYRNR